MRNMMLLLMSGLSLGLGCAPAQSEAPEKEIIYVGWTGGVPVSESPSTAPVDPMEALATGDEATPEEVASVEEEFPESPESSPEENEGVPTPEEGEEETVEIPVEEVEDTPTGPALYGEVCNQPGPTPVNGWMTSSPEAQGMDSSALDEAAAFAGEHDTACMVVIRNGTLVGEWYWGFNTPTTLQKSWSVTKSYSATVAGIAISRGDINSVHDRVADYVPEWDVEVKDWVTLDHLMSMTSGMKFGLIADNIGISLAKDMSKKAIDWPMTHTPGALWEYNNHTVQMIEPVLRNATGMPPQDYAEEHLFSPLGMVADWTEDKVGNPTMYMNVRASCRDHAKFGYLYLQKGCWDGVQLIDEEYIEAATSPSSDMNPGYGYWWWLNGQFPTLDSIDFKPKEDILHPDLPHDSFCAVGLGSQVVEVIPSEGLVIVRMGPAPHENLNLWSTQGAVLDALLEDGKQLVHNGVVNRVVEAIID